MAGFRLHRILRNHLKHKHLHYLFKIFQHEHIKSKYS